MPTALITGITGQDGSYLAELLLAKGYRVVGLARAAEREPRERVAHLTGRLELVPGDLLDQHSLEEALRRVRPDEIYHLAAQSVVHAAWVDPVATGEITAIGAARVLDAVRRIAPEARVFLASSSEVFGRPAETPQRESTPLAPCTPYGVAKAYAHWTARVYRESFGVFVATGILYNHESPRRGLEFVTRKVTDAVARIALGRQRELALGDLDARRDWGFAGDYVDAMWRMLQRERASEYVVGTGRLHTVREWCEAAFGVVGLDYRDHVVVDERLVRPADALDRVADATRAREELGWAPSVAFERLVAMMVEADLERHRRAGA